MEQFKDILENKAKLKIGKNLLSEGKIKEIRENIKKKGIIKIQFLKSATSDIEHTIAKVLLSTKSHLLDFRGNSIVLSKKPIDGVKINQRCKKIIQLSKELDNN